VFPRGRTLSAEGKQLILQNESEKYMRGDNIKWTKEILSQAKDIPSVGINGGMQSCLHVNQHQLWHYGKKSVVWFLISKGTFSWFFFFFWVTNRTSSPVVRPSLLWISRTSDSGHFHIEFRVGMVQPCKTLLIDTCRLKKCTQLLRKKEKGDLQDIKLA